MGININVPTKAITDLCGVINRTMVTQFNRGANYLTQLYRDTIYPEAEQNQQQDSMAHFHHNLKASIFNGLTLLGTRMIAKETRKVFSKNLFSFSAKKRSLQAGILMLGTVFWMRHITEKSMNPSTEQQPNLISKQFHDHIRQKGCQHEESKHMWSENLLSINEKPIFKSFSLTPGCFLYTVIEKLGKEIGTKK